MKRTETPRYVKHSKQTKHARIEKCRYCGVKFMDMGHGKAREFLLDHIKEKHPTREFE
jgi:ribosomal protein L34E